MNTSTVTRRQLLRGSGGVVITFSLAAAFRKAGVLAQDASPTVEPGEVEHVESQSQQDIEARNVEDDLVDSYLEVDADGNVTIYCGKVELGTGIHTALTQIVVEELDVAFDRARMIMGDTALTPDQGTTAGSKSIQVAGPVLRQAAAEARLVLLTRAAEQLGVPADELVIEDGVVRPKDDASQSVGIGELASEPFQQEITGDAPIKPPSEHTVVGTSVPRVDILAKLTGGAAYVQDVRLEGMLHGRVIRPHVRTMDGVNATIESVDDSDVSGMEGVQVVREGNFLGVVAEREEDAIRATEAITVTWSFGDPLPAQDQIHDLMREAVTEEDLEELTRNGDAESAMEGAAQTLEATYRFPFQGHAMMGPSCAVADVRADSALVFSHSQNVFNLGRTLADLLELDESQVRVIFREGSGCYGHSGFDDVAADAAMLSRAVGKPVRVQWMRADEFAWEPKMSAMTVDTRAGLSEDGELVAWEYEVWSATHATRPNGAASMVLPGQLVDPPREPFEIRTVGGDRNAPTNYSFPNNHVSINWWPTPPLRVSALRSLGAVSNVTANECFLDEVAAAAGVDPVEFRLQYQVDPRAIDVISEAARVAGWQPTSAGEGGSATPASGGPLTGRGIAYARYETEFAYAAVVAEVEVDPERGDVRVTRVVVAHDCGQIINPDGLTNQLQGNVIQGVSRALKEEVTWDEQAITSLDWVGYPILTFPEVPKIEVSLIDRPEEDSFGAGEISIGPVVAAVGNAISDAIGARVRDVPFTSERVLVALAGAQ